MHKADQCMNCGAVLAGPFCSQCGQPAKNPLVSLSEFSAHALESMFSVDSRIWRTITPLLFRPGALTLDYLAGRRERYLPPFRTYLILSLLFFLITSLFGTDGYINVDGQPLSPDLELADIHISNDDKNDKFSCQEISIENAGLLSDFNLEERLRHACEKISADSGSSLSRALIDNIPMTMFLFIPFVALLVKILYLFSHRKYVEHLLFLFHYHAAFFMILSILVIAAALERSFPVLSIPVSIVTIAGWIYIPAYLLVAMHRIYAQSWLMTNTKFILLLTGYSITMLVAFALVVAFTALTL